VGEKTGDESQKGAIKKPKKPPTTRCGADVRGGKETKRKTGKKGPNNCAREQTGKRGNQ